MIDFANWLTDTAAISEDTRAVQAWNRITDKPTSVVFRTPADVDLASQTVRIESDSNATENESTAGKAPTRKVIVFGVVNHPSSSIADTNMQEGYRFNYGNDQYRIMDVVVTLGELQGIAEAVG